MTAVRDDQRGRLDWLDPLRGFALLGILLNHLVEAFGPGPWFTNPSNQWPDFATRMQRLLPEGGSWPVIAVRLLGWLGDAGPGVFLLVSGVGLTWAATRQRGTDAGALGFYRRRALRIFPLYWLMHFVILGLALAVPGVQLGFASPDTLLSLLGLRFTDHTFFYISPSWWFVWLILQCYLVFPLLRRLLDRLGPLGFGAVALLVTLVSRGWGLLYSDSLYYWMTGIFAGTRLAEFAAGMIIGQWLARGRPAPAVLGSTGRIAALGGAAYVTGLMTSVTLPGTLVNNLLVTLGLTGVGLAIWRAWCAPHPALARAVTWTGAVSFPVFLLHQPPLRWTGVLWPENGALHLLAAIAVLLLAFPAGVWLERLAGWVPGAMRRLGDPGIQGLGDSGARDGGQSRNPGIPQSRNPAILWELLLAAAGLATVAVLVLLEPGLANPLWRRTLAFLLAIVAALALLDWLRPRPARGIVALLKWIGLATSLVQLFILPPRNGPFAVALGLILATAALLAWRAVPRPAYAAVLAGGLAAVLGVGMELFLSRVAPLEAGGWGERPALQVHPTRGYGLIPGRETRLRYNHYDYTLSANSEGLSSPEIDSLSPTPETLRILVLGDAFSMPEGLPREAGWPALLQQRLDRCLAPRQVQVINGGITGYGPNEELAQLAELLPRYRPELVLQQFFINDFDDIRATAEERRRSIGLRPRFPSLRQRLVDRSQLAHHADALRFRLLAALGRDRERREWEALLPYYRRGDNPLYRDSTLQALRDTLSRTLQVAREANAELLELFVPGAIAVSAPADLAYDPWAGAAPDTVRFDFSRPVAELRRLAEPLGIPVEDLSDSLRAHRPQPVYFRDSWHWNREGHRAAAAAAAAILVRRGALPETCAR